MTESSSPSIVIHFADGRVDTGTLCSSLLTGTTLCYLPNAPVGERRREDRVTLLTEVTIEHLGVRRGVDVSSRGIYVETLTPYPVGAILRVGLRFGRKTIELDARTVFTDPGIGMGLEFHRLSSSTRYTLEALVRHATTRPDQRPPRVRRASDNRRRPPLPPAQPLPSNSRYDDRRCTAGPTTSPIDVDFSVLKSVFFIDQMPKPNTRSMGPPSLDRHVIVAFRDGEEIQGVLHDLPPETVGFFIDLRLSEDVTHTVYVVKNAVKSIQTVV